MCKLKSAIILKDRVFVPDYDSHTEMLKELKIEDTKKNAERLFVRAELLPKGGDVFSPIESWEFRVDQDVRPDWFVEEYESGRMVEAVREWAAKHIYIGVNNLELCDGGTYYIKDCRDVIVRGSASIKAYGSASVKAYDSASVEACGSASVKACDSASVEAYGFAIVFNSVFLKWDNQNKIILSENATFKDNVGKIIYQSGDWEFRRV